MRKLFIVLSLASLAALNGCQMMKNCPVCRTVFGLEKDEIPAKPAGDSTESPAVTPAK